MGVEWITIKLSDAIDIIGGGTPKRSVPEYWEGDIPWLSVKDFNDEYRHVDSTAETISALGLENSSTKLLDKGYIIISARGTVGALAQLSRPMAFNQSCYGINAKVDYLINDFLYYLLKYSVGDLQQITHGAVFDTITRDTFQEVTVNLPPLPEQRAIAHILGSLDDKIELNRRMNATLEGIARTLFTSWFVDFDPVHARMGDLPFDLNLPPEVLNLFPDSFEDSELGPIPRGWKVRSLDEIAEFLNGLACQKYPPKDGKESLPVIKIRELRQGISENTDLASAEVPKEYIVDNGDVLFSWSGSLLVDIWTQNKGLLNQHLFKVTSTEYPKWFFYHWSDHHLNEFIRIASDKATTMGHIKRQHLSDAKVLVPDEKMLGFADMQIKPLLQQRIQKNLEIHKLSALRDTLLPKLISGEVRVPDAARFVAEAGI